MNLHTLTVEDLCVPALLGITGNETTQPQPVHITMEVDYDAHAATGSDQQGMSIDYHALAEIARNELARHLTLIETAAERIAKKVFSQHDCERVRVRVGKPQAIRQAEAATATYEQRR